MAAAAAAIPALMSAVGGGAAAAGAAAPALAAGTGAAGGVSAAMPAAGELFGSLGQAMPSADAVMAGAPEFGSGAMGPEFAEGEMFGSAQDLMGPQTGGLDPNQYQKKGGASPIPAAGDYPGQEAMSQYKDMSNYSSMGELSGLMNSQPGQKQNRMVTGKPVMNQYLQSLMGG